jgi:hypothetical protein
MRASTRPTARKATGTRSRNKVLLYIQPRHRSSRNITATPALCTVCSTSKDHGSVLLERFLLGLLLRACLAAYQNVIAGEWKRHHDRAKRSNARNCVPEGLIFGIVGKETICAAIAEFKRELINERTESLDLGVPWPASAFDRMDSSRASTGSRWNSPGQGQGSNGRASLQAARQTAGNGSGEDQQLRFAGDRGRPSWVMTSSIASGTAHFIRSKGGTGRVPSRSNGMIWRL